ncbi:MAG: DUF6602 domain-containing protein [Candidatus Competibacteraceae bacterium]
MSIIEDRLEAIRQILVQAYEGGNGFPSASMGQDREFFINVFLSQVLPNIYRCGTGTVIDVAGHRTGQLDIVVESPFLPSIPLLVDGSTRLYFSEGVGTVIEVKSNLINQWGKAVATASEVKKLNRDKLYSRGGGHKFPMLSVPTVAVGYTGWKTLKSIRDKVDNGPFDAILILDSGFFYSKAFQTTSDEKIPEISCSSGGSALWGLVKFIDLSIGSDVMLGLDLDDYKI